MSRNEDGKCWVFRQSESLIYSKEISEKSFLLMDGQMEGHNGLSIFSGVSEQQGNQNNELSFQSLCNLQIVQRQKMQLPTSEIERECVCLCGVQNSSISIAICCLLKSFYVRHMAMSSSRSLISTEIKYRLSMKLGSGQVLRSYIYIHDQNYKLTWNFKLGCNTNVQNGTIFVLVYIRLDRKQ